MFTSLPLRGDVSQILSFNLSVSLWLGRPHGADVGAAGAAAGGAWAAAHERHHGRTCRYTHLLYTYLHMGHMVKGGKTRIYTILYHRRILTPCHWPNSVREIDV